MSLLMSEERRSSALTLEAFNEYKKMIADTTYDLQDRLQDIDEKLQLSVLHRTEYAEDNQTIREQMQEEKEGILTCLEICDSVSHHIDHIDEVQRKTVRQGDALPDSFDRVHAASKSAVGAWLTAANNLAGCKSQLEARLQSLSDKLKHGADHSNAKTAHASDEELHQEMKSLEESINICENANKEADRNRTNVFEDVNMGDDGHQVIVSTVGDLIFAKKIRTGARSIQILGQMSDLTIRHFKTDLDDSVLKETPHHQEVPGEEFEDRYGTGHDLRPPKALTLNQK